MKWAVAGGVLFAVIVIVVGIVLGTSNGDNNLATPASSTAVATTTAVATRTTAARTPLPRFIGLNLDDAADQINARGYDGTVSFVSYDGLNNEVPRDQWGLWRVVDQTPNSGTSLARGAKVTVDARPIAEFNFEAEILRADLVFETSAAQSMCRTLKDGGREANPEIGFRGQYPAEYLVAVYGVGTGGEEEQAVALAIRYLCPGQQFAFDNAVSGDYATAPALAQFGDGDWIVGTDIQPGTYRTQGQVTDCYWERLRADGEIIDNDFITVALQAIMNVSASDAIVSSSGCGTWTKTG